MNDTLYSITILYEVQLDLYSRRCDCIDVSRLMNSDYASISQSGQRIPALTGLIVVKRACSSLYWHVIVIFCLPCLDGSLYVRYETALLGQPNDKPDFQDRCGV
jgi:hypothetical protein